MEHQKQPSCWSSGSNNSPKCSVRAQGIKPSKCPYRKLLVTLTLWYSVDIFIRRNNLNCQSWNNSVCAILLLENKLICVFDWSAESLVLPPFRCNLSAPQKCDTVEKRASRDVAACPMTVTSAWECERITAGQAEMCRAFQSATCSKTHPTGWASAGWIGMGWEPALFLCTFSFSAIIGTE